jgi:hypothetical protein
MRTSGGIVLGGAAAGVLDIIAAFVVSWPRVPPERVLQYIASGALGPAAFRGGLPAALAGLALHFVIATAAAAVYAALSRRWPLLIHRPLLYGPLFGLGVYATMNLVVLPLSRVSRQPPSWSSILTMSAIHIVCVGLPIALAIAFAARSVRRVA